MHKKTLSSHDLATAPAPLQIPFNRKNLGAVGLRKWVKFDRNGETSVVQADKHNLTQQLGVQVLTASSVITSFIKLRQIPCILSCSFLILE
jgi:hypothetical protein